MGEKKNLRLKLSAKKMLAWGFCLLVLLQMGAGEESCAHSAKLDLQIIVDSSASVGKAHFVTMMKKISKSLIGQFDIGKDKTRVALFKYSMNRVMKSEVSLGQYLRKKNLQKKIESTSYAPGWTMTAMAMENALKIFKEKQRSDKHTAKVCLVFTDCVATDRSKVPAASKAWAADGVTVFAIGIGKGMEGTAGHQGLKDIAGDDERAFSVENFEAIGEMAKSLLKKVCKNLEKVNPTKPPKPVKPTKPPKADTDAESFTGKGKDYRGFKKTTVSGANCQRWDSQTPHKHFPLNKYPKAGLVENFCRNPDGAKKPWCYTTGKKRWEYCFDIAVSWRNDGRCGPKYPINGKPGECNPNSKSSCCSQYGFCGQTSKHCSCSKCTDYSKKKKKRLRQNYQNQAE